MVELLATFERAAHLIGAYLDSTVGDLGVTQGEAHVLARLARGGPVAIGTLHREFGHKRSTLTNILDRLEQKRLVRRQVNPRDRRSFVVHLTASGRRTADRITVAVDDLERELAARVVKRDLAGVDAAARALAAIVGDDRSRLGAAPSAL
jgi:DNA-binding MarR family transcriptional regulator